jgi:transposase
MRAAVGDRLIPRGLRTEHLLVASHSVTISVAPEADSALCPACGGRSERVHSRYARAVSDLPWHGVPVVFRVRVRRFFCGAPSCERRIFRERLPDVAARARKTNRLEEALLAIVLELGLLVGRDALLARAKRSAPSDAREVRVLGVDDFAFRRGARYGTVLVDLERHKVVDLLPECSQESLIDWLEQHPEVETATRDRSNIYHEALAKDAPHATQIADLWHLLHNLALTLEEFLLQKQNALRRAASPEAAPEDRSDGSFASGPIMPNRPRNHDRKVEEAARKRRERLVRQWEDIRRLYLAGADLRQICRALSISARTVYRYKELSEPPPRRAYGRRKRVLDPYVPYLLERWDEGCRSGNRLYREIRERGYSNSEETCARFIAQLRRAEANERPPTSVPRARRGSVAGLSPTSKNVAALFMRREEKLNGKQKEYLQRLYEADGPLARRAKANSGLRRNGPRPRRREARRVAERNPGVRSSRDAELRRGPQERPRGSAPG